MQNEKITPELKAFLISIGSVSIDFSQVPRARGSTAGPGAGTGSVFFRSGDTRVRLSINKISPLSMQEVEGGKMLRFSIKVEKSLEENLSLLLLTVLNRHS